MKGISFNFFKDYKCKKFFNFYWKTRYSARSSRTTVYNRYDLSIRVSHEPRENPRPYNQWLQLNHDISLRFFRDYDAMQGKAREVSSPLFFCPHCSVRSGTQSAVCGPLCPIIIASQQRFSFLPSAVVAAGFHLRPRSRPSFCFRGVSAAGYRPGCWNLILSSRFRKRGAGGRGTLLR